MRAIGLYLRFHAVPVLSSGASLSSRMTEWKMHDPFVTHPRSRFSFPALKVSVMPDIVRVRVWHVDRVKRLVRVRDFEGPCEYSYPYVNLDEHMLLVRVIVPYLYLQ